MTPVVAAWTAGCALATAMARPPASVTAVADAGGRAVAVANAHPAVRAAAGGLTGGHDADGVAAYLEAVLAGV